MSTNPITEARIQKAVKENTMKESTPWLVFPATLLVGYIIGASFYESV